MSVWSGLAAGGLGIALVLVSLGMAVWEWHFDDASTRREKWEYRPFSAEHMLFNYTANQTDEWRNYSYDQLVTRQARMSNVFSNYGLYLILGMIAALAGVSLASLTRWKKVRGIFAGGTFLGACASTLYASFNLVLAIPIAARGEVDNLALEFMGGTTDGNTGWGPGMGWYLPIVSGLAFAWASSDLWHLRPGRKAVPMKVEVTVKRVQPGTAPALPSPPIAVAPVVSREPSIEEVFVIGSNGLLIKHMSRTLMTDKDRDVVGSMISAISSFVREAFTERDGEVHEVSLGDHHFVMCSDGGVVVAVLVTAGDTTDIVPRLRHLLAVLRDRYAERLNRWQGEPLEGIEDELGALWEPYHLPPPPAE